MSQPQPLPRPELAGPYSATDFGVCALGHALNGHGRCGVLNDPRSQLEVDLEIGPDRRPRPVTAVPTTPTTETRT